MKAMKGNKGLLDKKRFEKWEQERKQRLRKLSWKKAIRLAEDMLVTPLVDEWRDNSPEDHPVCLKKSLERMRRNAIRRRRYRLKKGIIANEAAKK